MWSMPSVGWWGTGPFFGEKTYFPDKRLAENMDLSPSRGTNHRVGDWSIFRREDVFS
jgi:hypothetical protein